MMALVQMKGEQMGCMAQCLILLKEAALLPLGFPLSVLTKDLSREG